MEVGACTSRLLPSYGSPASCKHSILSMGSVRLKRNWPASCSTVGFRFGRGARLHNEALEQCSQWPRQVHAAARGRVQPSHLCYARPNWPECLLHHSVPCNWWAMKRLCWGLYGAGGPNDQAFAMVENIINTPGGGRNAGVVDHAFRSCTGLALWLMKNWGGRPLLEPSSDRGYSFHRRGCRTCFMWCLSCIQVFGTKEI